MPTSKLDAFRSALATELNGKSVLITGSTGFVGSAIIREGILLNDRYQADLKMIAVKRRSGNPLAPDFTRRDDIEEVVSSIGESIVTSNSTDIAFHCATPASAVLNSDSPMEMFNTNVESMNWILSWVKSQEKIVRLVFASSGAVYGTLPKEFDRFPEDFSGGPDVLLANSAYAEGKRVAEFLLAQAGYESRIDPIVARLFAFSGVGLPLDKHFAIGNFVLDAVTQDFVRVRGSGADVRSYLDSSDLAIWLWAAACRGVSFVPLHIGSERSLTIAELAHIVCDRVEQLLGKKVNVEIQNQRSQIDGASRYVPSTIRTRQTLGVEEFTTLESSIDQMIKMASNRNQ